MAVDANDKKRLTQIASIQRRVEKLYRDAVEEAAGIGASVGTLADGEIFAFDNYPKARRRLKKLLKNLNKEIVAEIEEGVRKAWKLANDSNDALCRSVFGAKLDTFPEKMRDLYLSPNDAARNAFLARKEGGLGLSDRIWNYTGQFKEEIELALDLGIRGGQSASEMAADLKQYLKHPDNLFRRVRDEHGILHLSKRAALYHPGRGVYRSSYRNAMRLARTEVNIAYHEADHARWQKFDFVVGIEIILSNNHTCLGPDGKPHPFTDICDELAGRYPKDFKFTGWHPNCRCSVKTVLKTMSEMEAETRAILSGKSPSKHSTNEIKTVPPQFKEWMRNNADRIEKARQNGKLPYFLRDNEALLSGTTAVKVRRVRTAEQAEAVQKAWTDRKITNANDLLKYAESHYLPLEDRADLILAVNQADPAKIDAAVKALSAKLKPYRKDGVLGLAGYAERNKIKALEVKSLPKALEEGDIVSRLCGGDKTKGSCVSLALAYAGNKAGLDVLDFRGGQSQAFFSQGSIYSNLAKNAGGLLEESTNEIKAANTLLAKTVKGKEYILVTGGHAAIVRNVGDGKYEYLELQHPIAEENGFKALDDTALSWRFSCRKKSKYLNTSRLLDVETLGKSPSLRKLLSFINTDEAKQQKGKSGGVK